jgi:hypothetical protein
MNADQAKFLAGVIGQNLQGEWMHTYKAINAINDGQKDYKPHGNSRSAWDLGASHRDCRCRLPPCRGRQQFRSVPGEDRRDDDPGARDWYKHEMPKALEKVLALDGTISARSSRRGA